MPLVGLSNDHFEDEQIQWIRSLTIGGVLLIGAFICCLVTIILSIVITLTCDCWWKLGSFFNFFTFEYRNNFRNYFKNSEQKSTLIQMQKPLKRNTKNGNIFVNKLILNDSLEELTILV